MGLNEVCARSLLKFPQKFLNMIMQSLKKFWNIKLDNIHIYMLQNIEFLLCTIGEKCNCKKITIGLISLAFT